MIIQLAVVRVQLLFKLLHPVGQRPELDKAHHFIRNPDKAGENHRPMHVGQQIRKVQGRITAQRMAHRDDFRLGLTLLQQLHGVPGGRIAGGQTFPAR